MDTFDGYRAAFELLLQRESGDGQAAAGRCRGSVFDVLVGDAYVYGAMKGELVEIMAKQNDLDWNGPWKEEFFLPG